ncbi:MAG: hypothetical protein BWZ03_00065 [bacterium ADurb.BinA186]|nr:MAG: hypothetical protein BWZ03_00065 [bacterium ADurb.BinA186]
MTFFIIYIAGAFITYWLSKLTEEKNTIYPYDHTPWVILWPITLCFTMVILVALFFVWARKEVLGRTR